MDNISLRPCYIKKYTESELNILDICKKLEKANYISKQNNVNYSFETKNKTKTKWEYNPDLVYNFVYTYLKKIDIQKPVEEFETESESSESEYGSDLEYNI